VDEQTVVRGIDKIFIFLAPEGAFRRMAKSPREVRRAPSVRSLFHTQFGFNNRELHRPEAAWGRHL